MDAIKTIENYLVYLITECNLSVTLHPMENESLITFSELMRFNIHDNSYCTCIKATAHEKCLSGQCRVFEKCQREERAFCGICHAGVFEFVYPITDGARCIGFISVSGYASPEGHARMMTRASEPLAAAYATLKTEIPEKARVDTLILPLCQMLELAYRKAEPRAESEPLMTQILRYLRQNYAAEITSEEVCRVFYCSRSRLSHAFRKETGKSFREYLTALRVDHAKRLLEYSDLSVTEISFSVGFNDSNYFSNVFKKLEGCSPLSYRKGAVTFEETEKARGEKKKVPFSKKIGK